MKDLDSITTIVVTLITVLFSAGAWRFYENRMKLKAETDMSEKKNKIYIGMTYVKELRS
ncbi:MAG: hypothetical protein CM15mV42_1330 [uncultured marine virus]|nr:MAG: hypothetical protein CM15mV42_1330 [uncultured marine virus]